MTENVLKPLSDRIAEWQLRPSKGGVFEVRVGERLIFSKKELGRFPTNEEILDAIGHL